MIRGQKKKINAEIQANIHNRFDIEVIDSKTGEIKQKAQAENIILDQLWTRLLAPNTYFNYIHYGNGTETPSASDTSLTGFIGYLSFSDTVYTMNSEENWCSCRRMAQMSETVSVGESISEVGIAYGTSSSNLCTKALLKDMNGNALTIEKTETDIINIYATVFVHWKNENGIYFITNDNASAGENVFLIKALTGIQVLNPYSSPYYLTGINTANTFPTGTDTVYDIDGYTTVTNTYDASNKILTCKATRIPVGKFNTTGGLLGFYFTIAAYRGNGTPYAYISSKIMKFETGEGTWYPGSTVTGEAVGTGDGSTVDFSTDFRIHGNCTIYVDGAETAATVDYDTDITSSSTNIHFATAPAEGSVITATYFTDVIAKDENHVFDFEVTIQLGEKTA